jgi:group I intron endonuclease
MLRFKYTDKAKLKRLTRFKYKSNQPLFGKTHTSEARSLISKRIFNPMYGKKHCLLTNLNIGDKRSRQAKGVGNYELNVNLNSKFKNNVELAKHLKI